MPKPIHMMLRVVDEARSVRFYADAFGLEVADRFAFDDFVLLYLRNPEHDFELELTVNRDVGEPYDLGRGYGHLAFAVDDLETERSRLLELGHAPTEIKELRHQGHPLARYFFLEDPDGYKIELLQKQGRYQ